MRLIFVTLSVLLSNPTWAYDIPGAADAQKKMDGAAQDAGTATQKSAKELGTAAKETAADTKSTSQKLIHQAMVNVNTAPQSDLQKLPGIGPEKAKAIIAGRPYAKPEDLLKVKGIKEAVLSKIKSRLAF